MPHAIYIYKYLLLVILGAYREFDERIKLVEGKRMAVEVVRRAVEHKLGKFTKVDMIEIRSRFEQNLDGKIYQEYQETCRR